MSSLGGLDGGGGDGGLPPAAGLDVPDGLDRPGGKDVPDGLDRPGGKDWPGGGNPPEGKARSGNPVGRGLVAFGRFWWDFLIGDTPELFLATLLVIGLAEGLHRQRVVGIVVVLVAVVACLALSTWRGRQRAK